MKLRFIVNARSGRARQALPLVRAFAASRGAELTLTEHCGHGSTLAAEAVSAGCDLIVAVGGDGTMNEVASAVVGTPATLGLVPCGSGDGLGRFLQIHGSVERALDILEHGRPRLIDTGTADGHPFFTAAGVGFEAEIADRFNRLQRRGFVRYLTTSLATLRTWRPQQYLVSYESARTEVRAFTLVVANTDQYGNDARIAPGAKIDDGLLNLTTIPAVTALNAVPLVLRLFCRSIHRARGVITARSARFVVEREAPGLLHTDGEVHHAGRIVEFIVRPASLRVMAPR